VCSFCFEKMGVYEHAGESGLLYLVVPSGDGASTEGIWVSADGCSDIVCGSAGVL
jgi:hypothetical protein